MERKYAMKTKIVLPIIALALLLVSCASPAQPTPATSEPEAATDEAVETAHVTINVLPFLSFSPFFIAQEEGYFAEEGLEVEFVEYERGGDALAGLTDGSLDAWGGAVTAGLLNTIAQTDVRMVADRGYFKEGGCGYTGFLIDPDLLENGELPSPDVLKTATIYQDREGGLTDYLLYVLLKEQGLTLEDVTTVNMPVPAVLDAFNEDTVDLAGMGEPWVTRIQDTGNATLWVPAEELVPDYQFGVLAFGKRLLTDEPEVGERFIRAFMKAVRQYSEGKTDRNVEIIAAATELEADFLRQACWPDYRTDGQVNVDSLADFQQWNIEMGYMDAALTAEDIYAPDLLESASE